MVLKMVKYGWLRMVPAGFFTAGASIGLICRMINRVMVCWFTHVGDHTCGPTAPGDKEIDSRRSVVGGIDRYRGCMVLPLAVVGAYPWRCWEDRSSGIDV